MPGQTALHFLQLSAALYFVFDNFCRVHKTLGATPAMAAGIVDRVMHMKYVVGLIRQECLQIGTINFVPSESWP
jgi:hypothetical protein